MSGGLISLTKIKKNLIGPKFCSELLQGERRCVAFLVKQEIHETGNPLSVYLLVP